MVDRRKLSQELAAQIRPRGATAAPFDPSMLSRDAVARLGGGDRQIRTGRIMHAIPQLGWYQVVIDNMAGLFAGAPVGRADFWGAQSVDVYQSGMQVLCAIDPQNYSCTVIGQVPDSIGDWNDQYVFPTHLGSRALLTDNPASETFMRLVQQNDPTLGYAINPAADQVPGDWGCRTSLGGYLLVDVWSIGLAVDEVTGLHLDLLTQSFDLSGRAGVVEVDGYRLAQAAPNTGVVELSLGEAYLLTQDQEDPPQLDSQLPDGEFSYEPAGMQRPYTLLAVGAGVARLGQPSDSPLWKPFLYESLRSPVNYDAHAGHILTAATHWQSEQRWIASGGSLALTTLRAFAVEALPDGYQPSEPESSQHAEICEKLKLYLTAPDQGNYAPRLLDDGGYYGPAHTLLFGFAQTQDWKYLEHKRLSSQSAFIPSGFLFTDREKCGALDKPAELSGEDAEAVWQAAAEMEAVQLNGSLEGETPDAFDRQRLQKAGKPYRRDLLSFCTVDEVTGDISLINEHGAGIRIVGNAVYIEGGNIRVASRRDIRLLARDVSLSANRNATLHAGRHSRIYADQNVAVISGLGGEGGVLVESRGQNLKNELPDDPEQAKYSGITLKSLSSPTTILGGDILLRAGDVQAGQAGRVAIFSNGGDALLASRSRVILHSGSARLDTFGSDPFKPTDSHVFGPYQSAISGSLSVGQLWSQGNVIAHNDVQAVVGRVADAYGQGVGKILYPAQTLRSLQTLEQNRTAVLRSWQDTVREFDQEVRGGGRVLNTLVASELSSGYVRADRALQHYGSQHMADTIPHMYREAMQVKTSVFNLARVAYKPGTSKESPTYSFPGKPDHKIRCPVRSPLVMRQLQTGSWQAEDVQTESQPFEYVFATIKDTSTGN